MEELTLKRLDEMKNVDINTVDPNDLVDIRDVVVNKNLPKNERIMDFINQIKNPYCYKCNGIVVKICFSETEDTLEDRLEKCFRTM